MAVVLCSRPPLAFASAWSARHFRVRPWLLAFKISNSGRRNPCTITNPSSFCHEFTSCSSELVQVPAEGL
eukprot:scaffold540757_cov45-Prasinocladus_malaysianus.AAC.2